MCSVAHWTAAQVTTHRLGDFYLSHLTQLVINSVCKELELSTSQTRHGPVLALSKCESDLLPGLFPNFRRPPVTFGQGRMWFLKSHCTSSAELTSLMAQEEKHGSVFSGVGQARDSSVQCPPCLPPEVSAGVAGTGVSEELWSLRNECVLSYVFTSGQTNKKKPHKKTQVKRNQEREKKVHITHKMYF